ncbi:MAG: hypothetical protein ACK50V_00030 [Alphaproteobacteria bacterium]|jgi:hypothetical protein
MKGRNTVHIPKSPNIGGTNMVMKIKKTALLCLLFCQSALSCAPEILDDIRTLPHQATAQVPEVGGVKRMPSGVRVFGFDTDYRLCEKRLSPDAQTFLIDRLMGMHAQTPPLEVLETFRRLIKTNPTNDVLKESYLKQAIAYQNDPECFLHLLDAYAEVILGTGVFFRKDEGVEPTKKFLETMKERMPSLKDKGFQVATKFFYLTQGTYTSDMAMRYIEAIQALRPSSFFQEPSCSYQEKLTDALIYALMHQTPMEGRAGFMGSFLEAYIPRYGQPKTPHMQGFTAQYLMMLGQREKARQRYEALLGTYGKKARESKDSAVLDAYEKTCERYLSMKSLAAHYMLLSNLYCQANDAQRACDTDEMALACYPACENLLFNVIQNYILLARYEDAQYFVDLYRDFPKDFKNKGSEADGRIKRLGRYLARKRKLHDSFSKQMKEYQKEVLEKVCRTRGYRMPPPKPVAKKTEQETAREEKSMIQDALAPISALSLSEPKTPVTDTPAAIKAKALTQGSQRKEKPTEEPKEPKIKTRGEANLSRAKNAKSQRKISAKKTEVPPQKNRVPVETLISGSALKTFYKLFEGLSGQGRENTIKISLHDVEVLMDALHQDFDASRGKGSHAKVTLQGAGDQHSIEAQVLTLAKHKKLKPYQIEDLRLGFLKYGFYPKDKEMLLKKKGFLDAQGLYVKPLLRSGENKPT